MSNLDRVQFGGETVDRRTAAMLAEAERIANLTDPDIGRFHLCQGCWSHAAASAGTHAGPGAFDMYTKGYTKEQKEIVGLALRSVGFASWRRYANQGNWQEHWHGIAMGTEGLPPLAQSQVESYRRGRTGLVGDAADDQPRPSQILTWEQYQQEHPTGAGAGTATATDQPGEPGAGAYAIEPGRELAVELDSDADGLSDSFEELAGTRARLADSDGDGLSDGYEPSRSHTDPLSVDTDGDGVPDGVEVGEGTDAGRQPGVAGVVGSGVFAEKVGPRTPDADRDGLSDRFERLVGTKARRADSDGDDLADATEVALGTNPTLADSDHDGLTDGIEVASGSNALSSFTDARGRTVRTAAWTAERAYAARTGKDPDPDRPDLWAIPDGEQLGGRPLLPGAGREDRDTDGDGLTDAFEALARTDVHRADTDRDGLSDGHEALTSRTDPRRADTDGDGTADGAEVGDGSDAGRAPGTGGVVGTGAAAARAAAEDADADGLSDRTEKLLRTRRHRADSDGDQLPDATELSLGTDPRLADTDADGLADGVEIRYGGDPLAAGGGLGAGLTAGIGAGLGPGTPPPDAPHPPDDLVDADLP